MRPARVLLADDQPDVLAALRLLLKSAGYETRSVSSPAAVVESVRSETFDLLLMDLNYTRDTTSGQEGLELLARLKTIDHTPGVIVMTAWGSIDLAVQAMQQGARDFVLKPWDNERLLDTIRRHLATGAVEAPRTPDSHDLSIARRVQRKLLPQQMPRLDTLELGAHCLQAGAVGGDYYDFIPIAGGRMLFVLADVSGKGISAALLAANLQATLRSHCQSPVAGPAELAAAVNQFFFASTEPEHFATAFLADYDDKSRVLRYANCGHNAPLLVRCDGSLERLEPTGTVIGAFPACPCDAAETRLDSGDVLAVCSDGVLEARNAVDEQFGDGRLVRLLRAHADATIEALPATIAQAVGAFSDFGQEDDLTLLIARGR